MTEINYKLCKPLMYSWGPHYLSFKVKEMWEMENEEYDSYIQFLPRETMEDLVDLIGTNPFLEKNTGILRITPSYLSTEGHCINVLGWGHRNGYYCGNETIDNELFCNICRGEF